jgi:hypothetical protein
MHEISIDVSPHQLRKLKKGHKVRVKKGTGLNLIVHPTTYDIVSKAFRKNKGSEIQLSQEELGQNNFTSYSPPDAVQKDLNPIKPNPQPSGPALAPSPMTGSVGGSGLHARHILHNALNEHLGTNYGYLQRAGMDNAMNSHKSAVMAKHGMDARYALAPEGPARHMLEPRSRMVGGTLEKPIIGLKGGMLSAYTPPALLSQPFSANFQFQHFLPPQYQHFNSGGAASIGGSGLYV